MRAGRGGKNWGKKRTFALLQIATPGTNVTGVRGSAESEGEFDAEKSTSGWD